MSGRSSERQPATSTSAPGKTTHSRSPRTNTAAGSCRSQRKRSSRPLGAGRAETVTASWSGGWGCGAAGGAGIASTAAPAAWGVTGWLRDQLRLKRTRDGNGDRVGWACRWCYVGRGNRDQGQGQRIADQFDEGEARPRLGQDCPDAGAQPQQQRIGPTAGRQVEQPGRQCRHNRRIDLDRAVGEHRGQIAMLSKPRCRRHRPNQGQPARLRQCLGDDRGAWCGNVGRGRCRLSGGKRRHQRPVRAAIAARTSAIPALADWTAGLFTIG